MSDTSQRNMERHIGKTFAYSSKASYRVGGKRRWYRYSLVCEVTGINSPGWYEAVVREVTEESALPDDLQGMRISRGKVIIVDADDIRGSTATEITNSQIERVRRHWVEIAGEPVVVEVIGGDIYGFCSELAAYRIERKYNMRPTCQAGYSKNLGTWFCCLETNFVVASQWERVMSGVTVQESTRRARVETNSGMPSCEQVGGPLGAGTVKRYIALFNTKTNKSAIHAPDCKSVKNARRPFEAVPVEAICAADARTLWDSQRREFGYPKARICDCAVHV